MNLIQNGRKFSERVERHCQNRRIACHKQFLLSPVFLLELHFRTCKNQGYVE